jgi:hypothetical protein
MVIEIAGSSTAMRGDGNEVARTRALGGDAGERLGAQQLGDLDAGDRAVGPAPGDLLAAADRARADAAERDAAEVAGGVEVRDVGLQRGVGVVVGRRHRREQHVEQRLEVRRIGLGAVGGTRT